MKISHLELISKLDEITIFLLRAAEKGDMEDFEVWEYSLTFGLKMDITQIIDEFGRSLLYIAAGSSNNDLIKHLTKAFHKKKKQFFIEDAAERAFDLGKKELAKNIRNNFKKKYFEELQRLL